MKVVFTRLTSFAPGLKIYIAFRDVIPETSGWTETMNKLESFARTGLGVFCLSALLAFAGCQRKGMDLNSSDLAGSDYVLQTGDELEIKFFHHKEFDERVIVRPGGRITLQLIGDVEAQGKTPIELDEVLTDKYSSVLREPAVTVIVRKLTAARIFVGGEVKSPGMLPLEGRVTCRQCIMQVGGFLVTAQPSNVYIIRNQGTDTPKVIKVDLVRGLKNSGEVEDVVLQAQDIVYVPRSIVAEANLFVEQYIDKLLPFDRFLGFSYNYELNK